MDNENITFFDTDMHIFRIDPDPALRSSSIRLFEENRPTAMAAFSLLELKGNYIADLILLHKKVLKSDSLVEVYARIRNTGGRKTTLMLDQLILFLGGYDFRPVPWAEAKGQLITHLDAQIAAIWEGFKNAVDSIYNDFECSRAVEEPEEHDGAWSASIPRCTAQNTRCKINDFLVKYSRELKDLTVYLDKLDSTLLTEELRTIKRVVEEIVSVGFAWKQGTCRKKGIGDFLIGLQSKTGKKLISSNRAEHKHLSKGLSYSFLEFPLARTRLK